jgi:hypothetical protein
MLPQMVGRTVSFGTCERCIWRTAIVPLAAATTGIDPVPRRARFDDARAPGNVVERVLTKMGYTKVRGCGCAAMRDRMNEWGWRGCIRRRSEIVAWFLEKAKEQRIVVTPLLVATMLISTMREVRRG